MSTTDATMTDESKTLDNDKNPLLATWSEQPFHLPPFSLIKPSHFSSAFDVAMAEHTAELQSIVDNPDAPTFENTIAAYDRAGSLLTRVALVFSNMCSSLNTDELKVVQTEMTPILSRHRSSTYTLPGLFEKIETIYNDRESLDDPERVRLVERLHLNFQRQGASFDAAAREEYADLKARLAALMTEFAQNVMKDEEQYEIALTKDDLAGCPASLISAAREAAVERGGGDEGKEYVMTLSRSMVEPFLTYATSRDKREEVWRAWSARGELDPDRANAPIAVEMLKLRQRQAVMHGCRTFAEYQCLDRMAKTPEAVMDLLENVWERAKVSADKERQALEEHCKEMGDDLGEEGLQAWDWRYYAEKVRIAKYDFDESEMMPYLSLEKVTDAVMGVSNKLFGLRYIKREDISSYHPTVATYEVRETTADDPDKLVALFIHDNFARKYKSGGAWMSAYRSQTKNLPPTQDKIEAIPIISNNNNFAKSSPTLLSFDDAETLFHEMGHAHHGMLSSATYSTLAGTNVLSDFVELPSQLMEHWLRQPEVLKEYATHHETGEAIPDELLEKWRRAKLFNEGFATIEYTAWALIDMLVHQLDDYDNFDLAAFEREQLERLGMPQGIIMRHRPSHFLHLFASSSYAAGYYVYLWAEVLDADAFAAFAETGNVFDESVAKKAREFIYSSGNTVAPDELFRKFRGRDPDIKFMLEKKGLMGDEVCEEKKE
jgi:peptidyl-dipeptidase Dcp